MTTQKMDKASMACKVVHDLVAIFVRALNETSLSGPINVVSRITARNVRESVYTTCDDRAAQSLARYARGMGLGTVVHADGMAPHATYTITIR